MPRRLIARRTKAPPNAAETYDTAAELLTSVIEFMTFAEGIVDPVILTPGPAFVVAMRVARGGPIEL